MAKQAKGKPDTVQTAAPDEGPMRICFERIIPDELDPELHARRSLRSALVDASSKPLSDEEAMGKARMAVRLTKRWAPGTVLRCRFLDGSPTMRKKVKAIALQWEKTVNVKLKFVTSGAAEIRISFYADAGSWSAVGRDALNTAYFPPHQPTMNYGWLRDNTDDAEYSRVVLHEFGHALHQLLSNSTYPGVSGTSVARDFVELPSQIMEHWVLEPEVLKVYAKHYQTGEVIPAELIEKLDKAGKFNMGFTTVEFLAAALLDMEYHVVAGQAEIDIREFEKTVLDKYGLIPEIKPRYRSTYFNHIWNSGYAAGYYSYYWSEMLDADAFQAFKETGDIFNREVASRFENEILSRGGSRDPLEMYIAFRGKEPGIEALLENRGLK